MYMTVTHAKLASMLAIGVGSFIVGVAPACFVSRAQDLQRRLLLSCTLCFGGGVLLATSILHMLPEVQESLPEYGEFVFSCGFLLLYLVDECVHYFWNNSGDKSSQSHSRTSTERTLRDCDGYSHQTGYNAVTQNVKNICTPYNRSNLSHRSNFFEYGGPDSCKTTTYGAVQYAPSVPTSSCHEDATFLCHVSHTEPCTKANTGLIGLLLALTIHAVLEGLAIGLQKKTAEVLLLVGAVASHKFVVGFCLGLEFAEAGSSKLRLVLAIFIFAGSSVVGIGVGILTFQESESWLYIVMPVLQGLAGGTLLYVTVSEVFPRERARWHRNARRSAGILQFIATVIGFFVIFLLNNYVST